MNARLLLEREASEKATRDREAAWTARWETLPSHQQERLDQARDQIANAEAKVVVVEVVGGQEGMEELFTLVFVKVSLRFSS